MEKKYSMALLIGVIVLGGIIVATMLLKKNSYVADEKTYVWQVEYNSNAVATLVRGKKMNDVRADPNKLVAALNRYATKSELSRPEVENAPGEFPKITFQKIEQQTMIVKITNEKYLSEKMGSSGAQDYLAAATYTLTESPGIRTVEFVFEAGEHAMPGSYTRESFPNYKVVTKGER